MSHGCTCLWWWTGGGTAKDGGCPYVGQKFQSSRSDYVPQRPLPLCSSLYMAVPLPLCWAYAGDRRSFCNLLILVLGFSEMDFLHPWRVSYDRDYTYGAWHLGLDVEPFPPQLPRSFSSFSYYSPTAPVPYRKRESPKRTSRHKNSSLRS